MAFTNRIKTVAKLKEGDLKYTGDGFSEFGRKVNNYHVTEPLSLGRFVKISSDSSMNEQIIVEAANSDNAHWKDCY